MTRLQDPVGMRLAHRWVGPPVLWRLRAEVTGRELVAASGGVLLAANHRSFLDHYLLAAACPRPMRFLGKRELAVGLVGRFNVAMGMVPVDRGTADVGALGTVVGLLRAGQVVGVFPEGTRSPDGALHRFRSGLARMAAESGAPCVPVGMRGTTQVWPRHGRPSLARPASGTLVVRFGAVLPPPENTPRARRAYTTEVRDRIAALCGQPVSDTFAPIVRG